MNAIYDYVHKYNKHIVNNKLIAHINNIPLFSSISIDDS